MNSNTKSSEVLKQEVFTQLDRIDTDIDEMTQRLTPGQMIDDVIYYPRGGNPAATFDLLKSNPVGATFLTLGTLLLMEDDNHMSYESIARARVSGAVDSTRERLDQIKGGINTVKERIQTKKQDASGMVQNLKARVNSAVDKTHTFADTASDKVSSLKENLSNKISGDASADAIIAKDGASADFDSLSDAERAKAINDAKAAYGEEESNFSMDAVGDKLNVGAVKKNAGAIKNKIPSIDEMKEKVSGAFGSVSDDIGDKVHQGVAAAKSVDPLTYVAIGAGLGTLTGIGLPVSDSERAMVDRMDGKISAFTQDLQSALNESADILKDLVISDFKNIDVGMFKR